MSGDPNNSRIFPISVGDPIVDGTSARVAWGTSLITYAFPDLATDYDIPSYHAISPLDELNSFTAASAAQQSAALAVFSDIADFTNVGFAAGSDTNANIRIGTSGVSTMLGWAYHAFPNEITGGDVWIKAGSATPTVGTSAHLVLAHEIGHSMGLDHPWATTHDTASIYDTLGNVKYDGFEYTIMSYRGYTKQVGGNIEYGDWNEVGTSSFAQTFMMHDIYTLQYLYGADYSTNSGNNVYSWSPTSGDTLNNGSTMIDPSANKIFATIWDGGGTDTYDLSLYTTSLQIDLSPGKSSRFSTTQSANLGDGVLAAGNIYNALLFGGNTASLIENAIGGSAADTINGNSANNTLTGGQGADLFEGGNGSDTILGNGGLDVLNGGSGNDTLTGGVGSSNQDTFLFKGTTLGNDVITDWQDGIDYIRFQSAAVTSFAQLNMTQAGSNVVIDLPNNSDTITINNASVANFTAADFLFS